MPSAAKPRYAAFLSYSHRDKPYAERLEHILTRHWVPGRRRRAIFRDDQHLTAEGSLREAVRTAAQASRYLVVLASSSARDSKWVDQEVEAFLETRPREAVLVCRVGEPGDDAVPASIRRLHHDPALQPIYVDLRGLLADPQRLTRASLGLLAPLVGFKSKEPLIRARRRAVAITAAAGMLLAIAAGAFAVGRRSWKQSDELARERQIRALLAESERERGDDPGLFICPYELGRDGRMAEAQAVGHVFADEPGARLARAMAAAGAGRCDDAMTLVDQSLRGAPGPYLEAVLGLAPECYWPERVFAAAQLSSRDERLPTFAASDPRGLLWAELRTLEGPSGLVELVQISKAARGRPPPLDFGPLIALRDLLETADARRMLGDAELTPYLDVAAREWDQIAPAEGSNWNLLASLSARLAAGNPEHRAAASRALQVLLGMSSGRRAGIQWTEGWTWTEGWAWIGLASSRLGELDVAADAFAEAKRDLSVPGDRPPYWGEVFSYVEARALSGDWPAGLEAIDTIGVSLTRMTVRCRAIRLWRQQGRSSSFRSRHAAQISAALEL